MQPEPPSRPKARTHRPTALPVARQLRRDMTQPERRLWALLRAGRLGGVKFRRQHAIGPFVVDFYCAEASLVVELDGESHVGRAADAWRSSFLEAQGLRALRVTNDEVLREAEAVATAIARAAGLRG